jgi:hypothetical protein
MRMMRRKNGQTTIRRAPAVFKGESSARQLDARPSWTWCEYESSLLILCDLQDCCCQREKTEYCASDVKVNLGFLSGQQRPWRGIPIHPTGSEPAPHSGNLTILTRTRSTLSFSTELSYQIQTTTLDSIRAAKMTLTILTDDQIRSLLENLTPAELEGFRCALASALHEYSTGIKGETSIHQPERLSVHSNATGATTLFMPSCNPTGHGIKGPHPYHSLQL